MTKYHIILLTLIILIGVLIAIPELVHAQGPPPPPDLPAKPKQNPIDGGLGILAAAGGAYAIKKMRDKKK